VNNFKKRINMKKNLLLMMLCVPVLLAAQNGSGVAVSGLAVDAGTVTFNVSWDKNNPSDTVWVFVDYNDAGVMKRLPLLPGATLTATSAEGMGEVVEESGNNKGVWVVGNAKTADAGSFSATVKLLTAVKGVGGACAYGSNYPPMGKYISSETVKFTGTPPYDLTLNTGTDQAYGNYNLLSGQTLDAFTDKTGAPGIIKYCTAPGTTVNFTAFNPCTDAATGATWTLQDTREANNNQTYKVRKMQDGRIWMVQDLKFGDLCKNNSYNSGGANDSQGKVSSVFPTYYGNCTAATNTSTPPKRGYLYDWAAAVNKAGAYLHGSYQGCSGTTTAANACQGICPAGWHIPTGKSDGEFYDLHTNHGHNCATNNANCWDASSDWEGVLGGGCGISGTLDGQGDYAHYWSSTYDDSNSRDAYCLSFAESGVNPGMYILNMASGRIVRCVMNY
jgi:uncharacterized protein (TIGR02145 family)